jgi:hypothetical protein
MFGEYSHYKNNQEEIIESAVAEAIEDQIELNKVNFSRARKGTNLAQEFGVTDKINSPLKYAYFRSPEKFGTIEFNYPLTWSVYQKSDMTSDTRQDRYAVYFDEYMVTPTAEGTSHALQVIVEARLYEEVLRGFQNNINDGTLKATLYVVPNHEGEDYTGVRLDGKLENGASGILILLKSREKTMHIRCDIEDKLEDFEQIILPSFQFIP